MARHHYQHFHTRFIAASLGLGFAMSLLTVSVGQAATWSMAKHVGIESEVVAGIGLVTSAILIVFSWNEIRHEWHRAEGKHAHRN